jgi:tetratricopeptide (TPR) repeat protein
MAAQNALRGGRIREAEKLYDEALKKNPKDPRVYYNLGVLHGDYLKNPGKAVYYYRKYLDLAPTARDASKVRSWILDLGVPSER